MQAFLLQSSPDYFFGTNGVLRNKTSQPVILNEVKNLRACAVGKSLDSSLRSE